MEKFVLMEHPSIYITKVEETPNERITESGKYLLNRWKKEYPIYYVWDKNLNEQTYMVNIPYIGCSHGDTFAELKDDLYKLYDIRISNPFRIRI